MVGSGQRRSHLTLLRWNVNMYTSDKTIWTDLQKYQAPITAYTYFTYTCSLRYCQILHRSDLWGNPTARVPIVLELLWIPRNQCRGSFLPWRSLKRYPLCYGSLLCIFVLCFHPHTSLANHLPSKRIRLQKHIDVICKYTSCFCLRVMWKLTQHSSHWYLAIFSSENEVLISLEFMKKQIVYTDVKRAWFLKLEWLWYS